MSLVPEPNELLDQMVVVYNAKNGQTAVYATAYTKQQSQAAVHKCAWRHGWTSSPRAVPAGTPE